MYIRQFDVVSAAISMNFQSGLDQNGPRDSKIHRNLILYRKSWNSNEKHIKIRIYIYIYIRWLGLRWDNYRWFHMILHDLVYSILIWGAPAPGTPN